MFISGVPDGLERLFDDDDLFALVGWLVSWDVSNEVCYPYCIEQILITNSDPSGQAGRGKKAKRGEKIHNTIITG